MKIIILEGPDNIGKTTLANQLKDMFEAELYHWGPPPGDGDTALEFQLAELSRTLGTMKKRLDDKDRIEIWDRSVIGESAYGPLYRHYDHRMYWKALQSLRLYEDYIYFVVFYADMRVYKNWKISPKGDEKVKYQKQDQAERVSIRFVDVAASLHLKNTLFVNCYNYPSFEDRNKYVTRRIRLWLNGKIFSHEITNNYSHTFFNDEDNAWIPTDGFYYDPIVCPDMYQPPKNGKSRIKCDLAKNHLKETRYGKECGKQTFACGSYKYIRYVFIGEAPGYKGCGKTGVPFYDDLSGNLLQEALDQLHIFPTDYYMTNVVKCNPPENKLPSRPEVAQLHCVKVDLDVELKSVLKDNPNVTVIALGKVAGEHLQRLGIKHALCYHPAYYLRRGERHLFKSMLNAAINGGHSR